MRNLLILSLLVFSGASAMPEESLRELQSEELRHVYREKPGEDLRQLIMDEEAREHMLQQALFYAGRNAPVDNRAYLFALAVDLYHSLPPGPDPGGYEPGELGGKGDLMRQFQNKLGVEEQDIEPDRDEERETLLHTQQAQPGSLAAAIEIKYIRNYFREHIELDDFTQHASVAAEDLSFSNPTHYAALRAHMESMQQRTGGADDAGNSGSAQRSPEKPGMKPSPASNQITAPAITASAPEKTSILHSILKWTACAAIAIVLAAFMRRGRNR